MNFAKPHMPFPAALDDALREELLAMFAEDQAVRTGIPLPGDDRTAEELGRAFPGVPIRVSGAGSATEAVRSADRPAV